MAAFGVSFSSGLTPTHAQQVQLRCDGTLLEAQGSAEQKRPIQRLRLSLALEAEGASTDEALGLLQQRLAAVRSALQRLDVKELDVTSPSTFMRPAERGRAPVAHASLRVSGELQPARLQALVREVGGLPGVSLAPVSAVADDAQAAVVRPQLLRAAYQDALAQAREMAEAIGVGSPAPLHVQIESAFRPVPMAAAQRDMASAPEFDPDELPQPIDRVQLSVRFCAR
ncbi:SIMPL domain-containing protein [Cyanobium sp. ATX 6A2]|uniref:SIMPL domain-containing protein n=1 Tax=Cyanobium sp. ATX 6A2 TaxID=2823700 RepID=UPI0020CEC75C|nr:SIMPL domain-containing protein [Cyanobium sp. ATX 6A2]MCP9887578.1 SIMPL domain-containing protein [Cyanobium sp. ATX 6A2]